jgi:hypothetical protein
VVRTRRPAPILITDAAENPEREFRRREIRYVAMMGVRALCLVGAALLASAKPPLWGLWLALCLIGMVVLPWLAVVLANDRPAKSRIERAAAVAQRRPAEPAQVAIAAPPDPRVIDGD